MYLRSNWTTHSGADHFLYGEKYDSEKVGDVTLRGGIPAEKWQASSENFTLTHYFPHGNWSWQFNETNGQARDLRTKQLIRGDQAICSGPWIPQTGSDAC